MRITRREFVAGGAAAAVVGRVRPVWSTTPSRLARKDSFFGIHLDLHPSKTDTVLGRDITEEMIEAFLERVKPDFVQYDCKGHPGYAGYPTAVGTPSPGIVKDSLAIWRAVTARRGVALYIHYSGVWDGVACEQHPDWAAVRADGTRDPEKTSTFGPYVDRLLIPQIAEAAAKYDLDGAWIDGECWAVSPDFCEASAAAYRAAGGTGELPKGPRDPGWPKFLDTNRAQFRNYVRHYLAELHRRRPGFQVASNWLYTTYVPERPELEVDFLSGDYLGNASISTARLESRYLAATGKPWDLMAWGFQLGRRELHVHKPAVQVMQEASTVLSQGGGFQIYYQPSRAGHLEGRLVEVMGRVGEFCRARKSLSHRTESVPCTGVFFSGHSLYAASGKMFGGWGAGINPARGIVDALLESHHSVDVIPDWRTGSDLARYGLVVVPDWPDIGAGARDTLLDFARQGGNLLLVGAENARAFGGELGVRILRDPAVETSFVTGTEVLGNVTGSWLPIEPGGASAIETRYPEMDTTRDGACAATLAACGRGRIAAIYGPIGSLFAAYHAAAVREFFDRVLRRLYRPDVELDGPPTVNVALRSKETRTLLHLSNSTAMQVADEYAVNDFVPPVGPLRIRVRLARQPKRVTLEPGGVELKGNWKEGRWSGTVPRLDIHAVILFA